MRKKLFSLFALLLMAVTSAWAVDMKTVPLTLEAKTAGTIVVSNPQDGMKYSLNGGAKTAVPTSITVTVGDKVAFYGNGTSITSYYIHDLNNENDTQITGGTAECYIYGNIMSLVNEYEFATATTLTGADAFSGLFSNNAKLYNHATNDLLLPATTLTNYCYLGMFSGCSNLTTAPALPATTLAYGCYWDMFNGCSKLETAPELPATTLAVSCYNSMFRDCTELTTAPELPATTLADYCYEGMFSGCSKLNSVTCLATNISADYATNAWLHGVAASGTFTKASTMTGWSESETGIPTGWTVANSMKTVPLTLEAKTAGTIVVSNPQVGMQYSLDGGTTKNAVPASITVAVGDKVAFYGNGTNIKSYLGTNIDGGTADCYIYGNIMSLVDETGFATATTLVENAFAGLFYNNDKLYNHATNDLLLPATTLEVYCYESMFFDCSNLTTAPALPATTLAYGCYILMFYGCSNLTTAPELPATTLAQNCYNGMFQSCEGLTTAPELPATTLEVYCYQSMFRGCTELTTAPVLPATTLAEGCYISMFSGCSKLNSVNCLATNISAANATLEWLYGVAATGTFTKAEGMTGWPTGADGIPSGWTVKNNMKTVPLTLEAKTAGTIVVSNPQIGMKYKKNNDDIVTASSTATITIDVEANDIVAFYGNGTDITRYVGTQITGGTADCYIYGNIMSLVDETGFATATTLVDNAFAGLFYNNAKLYNHATNDLLLPATTLADFCYESMFSDCSNLTTAPELPATTLAEGCYSRMFFDCSNLTTAPELPATTLISMCYQHMFYYCSKLNSVTCLATDFPPGNTTYQWLYGVAASGTFTKASTATWSSGVSGIPYGWTVANKAILNDNNDIASQLTPGQTCTVEYSRTFTKNKPSTVCLPFDYAVKTGEQFYTFTGITKDGDDFVATMTEYTGANLVANTPYLYKAASTGATDFSGTYTLPDPIAAGTTTSGDWTFIGTYTTQLWDVAPTGIYGFSAQNANDGITQGEFVKVGAYVRVKPMRCYLMYKNGTEDYSDPSVRSFSGVPSTLSEPLPERIKVRFIDANGEVTGIGMLDTQTGEVSFDSEAWFTLDGVRLAEKPNKQGIYIHNGKKVIVK